MLEMENNSLQTIGIEKSHLKEDEYFVSLLQEAYKIEALDESEIENIQMACLHLLEAKSKKYTSGDSSIPVDDAEKIFNSNIYTIGLYLKSFPAPLDAVDAIKKALLPELYTRGRKILKTKTGAAQLIYHKVLANITRTCYGFYNITLTQEIAQFFKLYTDYHADYFSHELPGDLFSYPLCCPVDDSVGIEYVHKYLTALYYENTFCKCFPDEAINRILLHQYDDYNSVIFNICEQVLTTAIICIISGDDVKNLQNFDGWVETSSFSEGDISRACDELFEILNLKNTGVQTYLKRACHIFL